MGGALLWRVGVVLIGAAAVAGCGRDDLPPGPSSECVPTTCAAAGLPCGSGPDGCGGTLECGTCPAPQCSPKSCAELGRFCGAANDGCGAVIDCGVCACEVREELGTALDVVRSGTAFSSTGVDFGTGHYFPAYDAYLWTAPHTGTFVISGGRGGSQPLVRTGHCSTGDKLPGPTAQFPERYDLRQGQQVWITVMGDYGSRWALASNFYRVSINAALDSERGRCGNGFNDDGDAFFDCHDPDCSGAGGCAPATCADERVPSAAPVEHVAAEPPPDLDRFPQPCGHDALRHRERTFLWTAPRSGEFVFQARGAHAYAISLWQSCGGEPLACSAADAEDATTPAVRRKLRAGERVLVVMEGTAGDGAWAPPPQTLLIREVGAQGR